MILEEKYREIINKMTKTALVNVRAYFTDFTSFDIPQFCELMKRVESERDRYTAAGMIWCIRETGTHLIFPEYGENIDHFSDIVNMNDRYFYINLENETEFKEIRYSEAQDIIEKWKEI